MPIKRLYFFAGIWLGIVLGAAVTTLGLNERWKWEAFNHNAATWRANVFDNKVQWRWQWLDDYFYEELTKGASQHKPAKKLGTWESL